MKKVLVIAKFDEITKAIQENLATEFRVQLCTINVETVNGMIKVFEPDIVLAILAGFDKSKARIFFEISQHFKDLPVISIGNDVEKNMFLQFYSNPQFTNIPYPLNDDEVTKHLMEKFGDDHNSLNAQDSALMNSKKHILFIDDNALLLRNMKKMVEDQYKVSLATTVMQAIMIIGRERPDLIFLDYNMPVCDGKIAFDMLRNDPITKSIPVVFLTGVNDRKDIEEILSMKPAGYLLKPPSLEKIQESIKANHI